jgi:hypothetical protein
MQNTTKKTKGSYKNETEEPRGPKKKRQAGWWFVVF